jgi:hypothetical protein
MGFQANVLKVMIASPGDVAAEREIITEELYRWNNANAVTRELILQPVKWETHSSPQMGAHPQVILNANLLLDADIVVGIFGTRIGTATDEYVSGTVEEIKRHVAAGKLAMLYFSHVPIDPNSIDQIQWTALQGFKEECRKGSLYAEYASYEQLRIDFGHHLTIELNKPKYLWLTKPNATVGQLDPELSRDELRLLLAIAADRSGQVLTTADTGGYHVQTGDEDFVDDSPRSAAIWKKVVKRLTGLEYLDQVSEEVYELTEDGFVRADKEVAAAPLEVDVSFVGPPDKQTLLVKANKPVTVEQIDFLTSSEAHISSMEVSYQQNMESTIPIDYEKVIELFNAPRPDKNYSDHSGPAVLRLVLKAKGQRAEALLPVILQPKYVNNTNWVQLIGSKKFTLK